MARETRPFLLAIDSIQTIRDTSGTQMPGGPSQVRLCTDALVGLAKEEGIAVLLTGHVTKDGDLAGPRTLEHAVDVVLTFDGDPRSGLRVLSGGKNRYGAEGETAWFEMGAGGLTEIDPTELLVSGSPSPGAAIALPQAGRRALAVEVQALVGASDGPARRQATGLDPRRFQLVAAVLDRGAGVPLGRCELFGASSGGVRLDDPACDLAIAAALASAATGVAPPAGIRVPEVSRMVWIESIASRDGRVSRAISSTWARSRPGANEIASPETPSLREGEPPPARGTPLRIPARMIVRRRRGAPGCAGATSTCRCRAPPRAAPPRPARNPRPAPDRSPANPVETRCSSSGAEASVTSGGGLPELNATPGWRPEPHGWLPLAATWTSTHPLRDLLATVRSMRGSSP